jgi:replication factor C large subunit
MAAAYDLDEAGVAFVTGSGESTNKVASIVEDAQALREERLEDHAEGAFAGGARAAETSEADAETVGGASGDGEPSPDGDDTAGEVDRDADGREDGDGEEDEDDGQAGLSDFV